MSALTREIANYTDRIQLIVAVNTIQITLIITAWRMAETSGRPSAKPVST
jgi:hypothetical protein